MKRVICLGLASVLLAGTGWVAEAQEPKAKSLSALLKQVRGQRAKEKAVNSSREAEFRQKKAQQQSLLADARMKRAAAVARSEELEAAFELNENEIPELQETLRNRLGTLGELFGVVRQVAGDTRGFLEGSIVSAQLPGRADRLDKLAESKELPSIEELEELWFALQEEMTESGKVTRFPAAVVSVDGDTTQTDVVRVGPFNVTAGGKYLQYLPETGKLTELARQPSGRHLDTVANFEGTQSGVGGFSLDPSRGTILSLLIGTPSLSERVTQGGLVGYVIIGLGLVGLALVAERLVSLGIVGRKIKAQIGQERADEGNPLGRILSVYQSNPNADVETLELKLDEAILKETPSLERGNVMIKVLSAVAPLLGLLGTVTGMIATFQAITLFGTGDPKLMAGGISQALVTTVLGLVMAIPLLLLHSVVAGRSKSLIQVLEQQSAGVVATHAERMHGRAGGAGARAS
ncbi:MAG: MotA/TolQ/ExbB proton channel family protein [Candidatus Binatia bacterium]|nr:MotA/TolQ/ExbB proton channel family protein [Candidatus Binatia bacterium]